MCRRDVGAIANTYFPWGSPSASIYNATTHNSTAHDMPTRAVAVKQESFLGSKFESEFLNKVNIFVTDKTFSWITTRPRPDSEVPHLVFEAANQLLVSFALTLMAWTTTSLALNHRLAHFVGAAVLTAVATYGQLYNWNGFSVNYVLGMSANLIVAWLFVGSVLVNFVFPSDI